MMRKDAEEVVRWPDNRVLCSPDKRGNNRSLIFEADEDYWFY
jgi:hypothetical protein